MISPPASFPKTAWLLRLGIALQCFAQGVRHLFYNTNINSWLTNYGGSWGFGPEEVWYADRIAGLLLIFLAGAVFSRAWKPLLPLIALWFLAEALVYTLPHTDDPFKRTAILGHAVRYLAPLSLFLLTLKRPRARAALWLLLLGTALTFIAHGAKDIWGFATYIEYIDLTSQRFLDKTFDPELVKKTLFGIGVFDILAALILLVYRWRFVAMIMFAWGLISALSRITAGGAEQWHEVVLRANNAIAPLAIFFLLCALIRYSKKRGNANSSASSSSA